MAPNNNRGSRSPNPDGAGTAAGKEEGVLRHLSEVERTSEACLNELTAKINLARQMMAEKDAQIAEQEEFIRAVKGRVIAFKQKADELEVNNLKEMLETAKQEFENTKFEVEELSREMLRESAQFITDVQVATSEIEEIRVQFFSPSSSAGELIRIAELETQEEEQTLKDEDMMIEEKKGAIANTEMEFQAFQDSDHLLEYYWYEAAVMKEKIQEAKASLQAWEKRRQYWRA